jgi:hypothetical protein
VVAYLLAHGTATNAELWAIGGNAAIRRLWEAQDDLGKQGYRVDKMHERGGRWRYTLRRRRHEMAKKQKPWVWVIREARDKGRGVGLGVKKAKPRLDFEGYTLTDTWMCYAQFHQATGLSLKPGECIQARFSAVRRRT